MCSNLQETRIGCAHTLEVCPRAFRPYPTPLREKQSKPTLSIVTCLSPCPPILSLLLSCTALPILPCVPTAFQSSHVSPCRTTQSLPTHRIHSLVRRRTIRWGRSGATRYYTLLMRTNWWRATLTRSQESPISPYMLTFAISCLREAFVCPCNLDMFCPRSFSSLK